MKITSQNILIPSFDNERKLAQKVNVFAQTIVTVNFLKMRCTQFNCRMAGLEAPEYRVHMSTFSIKPLSNFKLLILKVVFVHELVLRNRSWQ